MKKKRERQNPRNLARESRDEEFQNVLLLVVGCALVWLAPHLNISTETFEIDEMHSRILA
jgi:hypothetical protein